MKRIGWIAAGLVSLVSCAHSSEETKQESSLVLSAQDGVVQAWERAAHTQHVAAEEQAKAEELQRRVVDVQRKLAEEQATALAQTTRAEQAQREAQRTAVQAHADITRAQRQALRMQRSEAQTLRNIHEESLRRWTRTEQTSGTALDATDDLLRLRSKTRGDLRLTLNPETAVTVDGRQSSAANIQPGSDVRAYYQIIDGRPLAVSVDAKSKHKAKLPAEKKQ